MYTLSKPNYKIMSKTRRGITQKVDSLEIPSSSSKEAKSGDLSVTADMSTPKPVFYQVNGRRSHVQKNSHETITPQHEEIIRYVQDSWRIFNKECESTKHCNDGRAPSVVYYQDNSTNQHLINFKPFDLELFWGERLLRNIQQSV